MPPGGHPPDHNAPRPTLKFLFSSVSAIGHVNPMIPLALALQDRGHEIRWVTGPDACGRLEAVGIAAVAVGGPWEAHRVEYLTRFPEARSLPPAEAPDHTFPHLFGEIVAAALFDGVLDVARTWRPDLVVHEGGEFTGAIAAASIGVPSVTHSFGGLTPATRIVPASELVASLWRLAGLEPRPFAGFYEYLYLDIYPASLQSIDTARVPFRQAIRPMSFDTLGDQVAGGGGLQEARGDRPFVYLTFGTIRRDPGPLRAAVEAIATLDVDLLVTVGPAGDPEAFGALPKHVRVERYVPQSQVFGACDVVASHAGSGTFLGALGHGIPQLCLPQGADQFLNADACRHGGVGLTLEPVDATGPAIAAAVARLLDERSFRHRAREIASEIAAMPDPGSVVPVLEALVGNARLRR